QLNDEDRQVLLSLLQEYSDKLNSLNFQIEQRITFYNNFSIVTCLSSIMFLIVIFFTNQFFPYNLSLIIFFLVGGVSLLQFITRKKTKRRILEKQAEVLAIKLERLVRTASQYQENVEKNYIRKIELDLRLGDAESSLSYYYKLSKELNNVVNSLKK
ncbi:MAG: hypothetical protein AB4058_14280, partial [Microcystaceae cyanobacterium]